MDEEDRRQAKMEPGHHCLLRHRSLEISFSRHPLLGHFENSFYLVEYRYHSVNYLLYLSFVYQHLFHYFCLYFL